MQLVSLPYKLGGNTHEMESTERKTATLLEPLTMDRLEDGSYDPSTYSEYWIYKDAVFPVTHTISLCLLPSITGSARLPQVQQAQ